MKKLRLFSLVLILFLVACGDGTTTDTGTTDDVDTVEIVAEDTAVAPEPTVEPVEPTAEPTEPAIPADIRDASDFVGLWDGSLAGEHGFIVFTDDGTYLLGLNPETVMSEPRVTGEYWIEDGQFHILDLTNAGHWTECANEGVYGTAVDDDGTLRFVTIEDGCNEGGFTRNYIMENALWTHIGDVPAAAMPEDDAGEMADESAIDAETLGKRCKGLWIIMSAQKMKASCSWSICLTLGLRGRVLRVWPIRRRTWR